LKRWSLLFPLLLSACANIIGLEDRELACRPYCEQATSECRPNNTSELFYNFPACLELCRAYPQDPAQTGNTFACRQAKLENVTIQGEQLNTCPPAGPGGADPQSLDPAQSCGTNCEGYCTLYGAICNPIPGCVDKCRALPDTKRFNATADFMGGLDTLQCRMAHLGAAAAAKGAGDEPGRQTHCSHSGLRSSVQCDVNDKDHPELAIKCDDFCLLDEVACQGSPVYENREQCKAVCEKFTPGTLTTANGNKLTLGKLVDPPSTNSVRCRRERAYSALELFDPAKPGDPNVALECSRSSLASGQCGASKCESYCALAQSACPNPFNAKYKNDLRACESECIGLADAGGDKPYSVAAGLTGMGLSCRALHVARALGPNPPVGACEAALGEPGPTGVKACQ
jgi:hypothetical protein